MIGDDPFDSSIDASWLGAAPNAEDTYGNPIVDAGPPPAPTTAPAEDVNGSGAVEAGA